MQHAKKLKKKKHCRTVSGCQLERKFLMSLQFYLTVIFPRSVEARATSQTDWSSIRAPQCLFHMEGPPPTTPTPWSLPQGSLFSVHHSYSKIFEVNILSKVSLRNAIKISHQLVYRQGFTFCGFPINFVPVEIFLKKILTSKIYCDDDHKGIF